MICTINYQVTRYGRLLAGVDEVGRGPLAGPVVAAAVILKPRQGITALADSKSLGPEQRTRLAAQIREEARAWALGRVEAAEIDALNIHRASLLAMQRAVEALSVTPDYVLVDGKFYPDMAYPGLPMIKGDQAIAPICAASILAKVARDEEMIQLDVSYPGYALAQNKGYPTKAHLDGLKIHGVSPIHRRSFGPVRAALSLDSRAPALGFSG